MVTVQVEASIPSPSLWRLGTLSEQSKGKLKESQGTARDAAIAVGRHVSPLRDKGWVYRNWGLEWTCVGILRELNLGLFWDVYWIIIFRYDYEYNIIVFYVPIDVLMRIDW